MSRNPENRRVEILLSPEQYDVLKDYTEYEYLGGDDKVQASNQDMAAAIREILGWAIPSFGAAKPLVGRGKYKREKHELKPKYHCPACDSLNTHYTGDERIEGVDPEGDDDLLAAMLFECADCGRKFRDNEADMEMVDESDHSPG